MLYAWLGIGATLIIGNLFLYLGNTSFNQAIIKNYSKKYEILEEEKLLKLEYLFRIIGGCIIFLAGLLHKFHNSLIVSFLLFFLGTIISFIWYYYQRKKYLSRKELRSI